MAAPSNVHEPHLISDRAEIRWWTAGITFAALAAMFVAIIAIVIAHDAKRAVPKVAVAAGGPTRGASTSSLDLTQEPPKDFKAPHDPTAPADLGGTVHELTFEAREVPLEVAPGHTQMMWTFNGTVPGPVLRGKVGDTFRITLVNKGTMGHSIDFHASQVAPNVHMKTINPGESLVYEFRASYSGIFMYHCGTPPVIDHVANGMYGAVIIDPPDLARVDHEYVMVQSELYAGTIGKTPDVAAMMAEQWDGVMLNGYVYQYKYAPIRVEPGQRIRVWVLDAGPSENSSFHVIGTIFDTVYKEGAYLLRPGPTPVPGGSQALDLMPAQGGFVEFTLPEAGLYTFLTHKFASAFKGAAGVFKAGDVAPAAAAGH